MLRLWTVLVVPLILVFAPTARAGLYYSGEPLAELPSQWRGYLLDQRMLRSIAVKPTAGVPASSARLRYLEAATRLEKTASSRKLTADELADQGALYLRLGETTKTIALLRAAHRDHPNRFAIIANLGTAWQLHGDLQQAVLCLEQAVRLAPGKMQKAEEYHLKLVRERLRAKKGAQSLDDLFGVRYLADDGSYQAAMLAAAEKKKLPVAAVAIVQQLALWLPDDALLLWQLAELANAFGDVREAAAMMDGCVTQFNLQTPELKKHRQILRAAADALGKTASAENKEGHEQHAGGIAARSQRPLLLKIDLADLPPISVSGVNQLPWELVAETTVDNQYKPTFAKYLKELEGKDVALTGFLQPLNQELEQSAFMLLEYPVGCWYCETPDVRNIIWVELPKGQSTTFTREMVRVVGQLSLNSTDPDEFLYNLRQAKITKPD